MSESYHTSRMRETCTSGSQEGRGETVIGICLSIRPPRLLDREKIRIMEPNEITAQVVDAAFKIHTQLGPGLLETVYEVTLAHEAS